MPIAGLTLRTSSITEEFASLPQKDHRIEVLPPAGFLTEPRQIPNLAYEKALFRRKLRELGLIGEFARRVMNRLGDSFAMPELRRGIDAEVLRNLYSLRWQSRHAGIGRDA